MPQLHKFYEDPMANSHKMRIWYIHFLTLLALGKVFVVRELHDNKPPGSEFFLCAIRMLPETTYLLHDFVTATEILCCMTLYFQALDARISAFDKVLTPENDDSDNLAEC